MLTTENVRGLVTLAPHASAGESQPAEKSVMMRIKILRNTVAGGVTVNEGQIVEVPDVEARFLIGLHKAEAVEGEKPVETADAEEPNIETTAKRSPKKKS